MLNYQVTSRIKDPAKWTDSLEQNSDPDMVNRLRASSNTITVENYFIYKFYSKVNSII